MSTNSYVIPNDMSDLCRVCLQLPEESQYLDLTTIYDEEDNLTYGECFTICTEIDLSAGEGIPHYLCKSCGLELQMSYDFYKKIEESKRVIEQFQRQIKAQKVNSAVKTKTLKLDGSGKRPRVEVINEKFIIIDDEEHLPVHTEETEEECVIQPAPSNVNVERDEIDVNMCDTEANAHHQVPSHQNSSTVETINRKDAKVDVEDQLEIEDYQNLETLEEEETETLQIKCDENIVPIQITKFKTLENGENEVFVEYAESYNEKDGEDEEENDEREDVDVDVEYTQEIYEQDTEDHLRWQENVVAVANKEHLPIEIEDEEEEGGEEVRIYETSKCNNNEKQVIINDSSQDEANEDEEETNEKLYAETAKRISNTNKINDKNINNSNSNSKSNSTERKRHVGSYSCDICHRVYPNYSRMKNHRRCHEADRPKFSCSHCGRLYATKQARDCHIQTAHDKSGYTCSICNKVFAIRKSLEIHVRYHTGDFPYACKLCDRKFAQACHLNTHINVKHNQIRFSCDYPNCGKFFTSSSSLRNHEYTHSIMPFECEYCQQGYPAKSKLRIHIQRKHGMDLNTEQLEKMHPSSVMLKDESINSRSNFTEETITITPCIPTGVRLPIPPGPPFVCEICGHSSNTKNLLASHRHRKHRHKESPYQCGKCDKSFNSKDVYERHIQRLSCQHYPEFTCEYCDKKIIGSANYKIHLRFHKKIYPFECSECGKGFMMAVHLKAHVQTKHENMRYICEVTNCDKNFQSLQSLKSHMYVHLGSLPYSCEYCEKPFPNRGKLRWHIKTVHDFEVCSEDMDRMMVTEEIAIKAKVKPVEFDDC